VEGELGAGITPSMAMPCLSRRLLGMTLPGSGWRVVGSFTTTNLPFCSTVCEESPRFSKSVGRVVR
jgi:hypothetical protein